MSQYVRSVLKQGNYQSEQKYGSKYAKRKGIHDGKLHRRQQGTLRQIDSWIDACVKDAEEGRMDLTRAKKIVQHWMKIRDRKLRNWKRSEW